RIRARLTAQGARFQTRSDSEIVLHLYEQLGLDGALEQLRGEFAFALYDRNKEMLFLVRDRFGIKPLYWTQAGDQLVFGSELKVLFANPAVERKFSSEGLFHQLMQTMVPGTTAFSGVHQVKPGHVVSVRRRDGRLVIDDHKYWDLDFPREHEREDISEESAVTQVRDGLLD